MSGLLFWLLGLVAVACAIVAVTRRNPIYAAFFVLMTMGCLAVEFLILHAPFLAAMQIILYAGAIVVLFVFVIMLLSLKEGEMGPEAPPMTRVGAAGVSFVVFLLLAIPALRSGELEANLDAEGQFGEVPLELRLTDIVGEVAARRGFRPGELLEPPYLPGTESDGLPERLPRRGLSAERAAQVEAARAEVAWLASEMMPGRLAEVRQKLVFVTEAELQGAIAGVGAAVTAAEGQEPKDAGRAATLGSLRDKVEVRARRYGSIDDFIGFLYSRYVVAFELVSLLIFAAVAGAIVLARRRGFMGLEVEGEETRGGMFL